VAATPLARLRGLLGRDRLEEGQGLLIRPTWSVHTAFMRFPIDVVFLDRNLRVLEVVERLAPWRAASRRGARSVLELPAGACARTGLVAGDRLESFPPLEPEPTLGRKLAVALTWVLAVVLALVCLGVYGGGSAGLIAAAVCAVLVRLSFLDATTRRLPNRIVLPAAAATLALRLLTAPGEWPGWLGASLGGAALLLVVALARPGGLGLGDVKLMLLLGAALGAGLVPALLLATVAAALAGLAVIARHGWAGRSRTIPLGPFLAFGVVVVLIAAPVH
jgi:leader peptidase (prepilin peptidase)/N-methyltransferase